MLPHYITPFRNPHGSISFFPTLAQGCFPFLIYGYLIEDFVQNNTSLVRVKMTSYGCCEYIPPFSQKVMYHINPAVIKSILSSMPQSEFIIHARYIRRQVYKSEPGNNRRAMYINLYIWCRQHYKNKFR